MSDDERRTGAPALSRRKRLAFLGLVFVFLVVFAEFGVRVAWFVKEGLNPYYLTFGFVSDIETHCAEHEGYTKFHPGQDMHQMVEGEVVTVGINSDGFRNAFEFDKPKPPNVFRIATLGASSTFGYENGDDETYPYLLEQRLAGATDRRVQVFNLGIPHLRLGNILALARSELPSLEPDLITLYTGYNNSMVLEDREEATGTYRLKDWLYSHSVAYRVVHPMVRTVYMRIVSLTNRDVVGLPNLSIPVAFNRARIEEIRAQSRAEYRRDVEAIADMAESLGARLVLVTQSYTLYNLPNSPLNDTWRSYRDEVEWVSARYEEEGSLEGPLITLLIHSDLMETLRDVARVRGLTLLEGIDALDPQRSDMMASFVHLTPEANGRLADLLAREVDRTLLSPPRSAAAD